MSAIVQNGLHTIKQKAPNKIRKVDNPTIFEIQVANGHSEKPFATATLQIEIEDNIFPEHFVVMKNKTGPIIRLHFMRNNSHRHDRLPHTFPTIDDAS